MQAPELPTVFVSHGRHDSEGQLFLSNVFDLPEAAFRPHFYSIEPRPPHAKTIRNWIRHSAALFFLLSDHMLNDHTRAWVGYEVGIASQRGLPVVVIESRDHPVNLPVPGATHYLRRPASAQENMDKEWKAVASSACSVSGPILEGPPIKGLTIPGGKGDPKPGEVIGHLDLDTLDAIDFPPILNAVESMGVFRRTVCPSHKCRASFLISRSIHERDSRFPCPSCRNEIENPDAFVW